MPIGLEEKQAIVAEVHDVAGSALSAVVADYRGVSVEDMTTLRKSARDAGVQVKVVKTPLSSRLLRCKHSSCSSRLLVFPTVMLNVCK